MTWYDSSSSLDVSQSSGAATPARFSRYWSRISRATLMTASIGCAPPPPPFTFAQSLRFGAYRGRVWHQLKKPWSTLRLPATWIIMLQYGGLVGSAAVISTVGPQILQRPPYAWGEHTGLLFVGALAGVVAGGACTAALADRRLRRQARDQEEGYAEPESRLALMVPSLGVGTAGLLVFGFCAQYPGQDQWVGLEFAYGMVAFALAQVPSVWFSYVSVRFRRPAYLLICI